MPEVDNDLNLNKDKENKDHDYWRSFRDLFRDKSLIEANQSEFAEGVKDDFEPSKLSGISRRKFLALAGASAALAGVGCSDYRSKGHIIPYNKMPEEIVVGNPNYYASTSTVCAHSCGILIKTREGRPIKVSGNPDHPVSKGKTCSKCEASILSLYDPERLKFPMKKNHNGEFNKYDWKPIDDEIIDILNKTGDKQIAFVAHSVISPTGKKVLDDFTKKYPNTKIYSYELFNEQNRNSAWKKCYGADVAPLIKWNDAKIIVGLESDFLGTDGNKVETARLFAEGREVHNLDKFNRLYVVEGSLSVTGMSSDYRFRLRPDAQYEFVMSLLNEVSKSGVAVPLDAEKLADYSLENFAGKYSLSKKNLKLLVNDLVNNQGASIVYAGRTLPEQVHIAVNLLNEVLGNSKLYRDDTSSINVLPLSKYEEFEELVSQINSGNVGVLIHYDSNPVFHLPHDLGYAEALKKVHVIISFSGSQNDSSVLGNYTLPINHDFESWGDAKTRTGFYSMQQPVIDPIFDTRQKEAILLTWLKGKPVVYDDMIYHKYLMDNWQNNIYPSLNSKMSFKELWVAALHDGVVIFDEAPQSYGSFNKNVLTELQSNSKASSNYLVVLRDSYQAGDGRFLNNGWMLEFPHPISKITWDNYAAVSHTTAKELGIESNDKILVEVGNRKLEIPAFIQPGAADKTVTIELGFGRKTIGIVGTNVGFDANVLRSKSGGVSNWIYKANKVSKGSGSHKLVSTMEHTMFAEALTEDAAKKRKIIQEGTVKEYKKNPHFIKTENPEKMESLYNPHAYPGVKWGMAVDLNKCIGCGECVIACNAENNIPIVGKDQVAVSREMEWLRVDRYYSGTIDEPVTSNQLMLCQQCDNAPCENVCPVAATTHSPDGLNQMIYNRCVGTRYCSNNCPYKVRRFNFFNYRDHFKNSYQQSHLFSLVNNPEVTVRSRGVMEKCTFCIQRIMDARSEAIKEHRPLKGSDVRTACQDACNTEAIKFGDMNDKESEFYKKYRTHELGYYVLEDVNTRPNVTYIAKLRNTESEEV